MAAFDAASLASTTLEAALLEVATKTQDMELTAANNPNNVNNIQITYATDAQLVTIAANLNVAMEVDPTTGRPTFAAIEYLT